MHLYFYVSKNDPARIMEHLLWNCLTCSFSASLLRILEMWNEISWYFLTMNARCCLMVTLDTTWSNLTLVCLVILQKWAVLPFMLLLSVVPGEIVNSLWPGDAIWQDRSGSTLAQVMACCLTAPSHYLNQCWLIFSVVLWHSSESNFTAITQCIIMYNNFENHTLEITSTTPWVKSTYREYKIIPAVLCGQYHFCWWLGDTGS